MCFQTAGPSVGSTKESNNVLTGTLCKIIQHIPNTDGLPQQRGTAATQWNYLTVSHNHDPGLNKESPPNTKIQNTVWLYIINVFWCCLRLVYSNTLTGVKHYNLQKNCSHMVHYYIM